MNASARPLKLFQGPRVWHSPNASPFCVKVEFFLRHFKIPYEVRDFNPRLAPRGKMPFIGINNQYLSDSELILNHLCQKHQITLDTHLSEEQKQWSHLMIRTMEEGTYFIVLWERWMVDRNWQVIKSKYFANLPPLLRSILSEILRRQVKRTCWGQGISRYEPEEILAKLHSDLRAFLAFQSEKGPYFLGEQISRVDFSIFSLLVVLLKVELPEPLSFPYELKGQALRYVDWILTEYFSDLERS